MAPVRGRGFRTGRWTPEETHALLLAVQANGTSAWTAVAAALHNTRSREQCEYRMRALRHTSHGKWSREEDDKLRTAIDEYGPAYTTIARVVFEGKRSAQQLRDRWCNRIHPALRREPWTATEDATLRTAIAKYGARYSRIAGEFFFNTRNGGACRRRALLLRITPAGTSTGEEGEGDPTDSQGELPVANQPMSIPRSVVTAARTAALSR